MKNTIYKNKKEYKKWEKNFYDKINWEKIVKIFERIKK